MSRLPFSLVSAMWVVVKAFLVVTFMVLVGVLLAVSIFGLEEVSTRWTSAQPLVMPIKWIGLVLLFWLWNDQVEFLADWRGWPREFTNFVLKLRWRLCRIVIVVEILLLGHYVARAGLF